MATQAGNPARAKGNAPSYSVWRDAAGGMTRGVDNHTGLTPYNAATADVVVAAILSELGSNAGSVAFSADTHSVAASTTVPANVGLQAVQGTLLRPASGKTLAINGTLDAGPYQVFDLSAGGTVVLNPNIVARPEWFGDLSANAHVPINAAITAMHLGGGGLVALTGKDHPTTDNVTHLDNVHLVCVGNNGSITMTPTTTGKNTLYGDGLTNFSVQGITARIVTTSGTQSQSACMLYNNCQKGKLYGGVDGTTSTGVHGGVILQQTCQDIDVDLDIANLPCDAAGVGGTGFWAFRGANRITGRVRTRNTGGSALIVDAGTSEGGGIVSQDCHFSLTAYDACQGLASGALDLEGAQRCRVDVMIDGTATAGSVGVRLAEDQNSIACTGNFVTGTVSNVAAQVVSYDGAAGNTVILRARNAGMAVPAGSVYAVVHQATPVLTGGTQFDCTDNTTIIDMAQDSGVGKYSYGVLFDGSVVNCYRNRVVVGHWGGPVGSASGPATGIALYNGANAPATGANANSVEGSSSSGHIVSVGAAPTVTTLAGLGTSPPTPIIQAGSTDAAGAMTFGTGASGTAAGNILQVPFAVPYQVPPFVRIGPTNGNGYALGMYVYGPGTTTTHFTIACANVPATSQPNTSYGVSWQTIGSGQ